MTTNNRPDYPNAACRGTDDCTCGAPGCPSALDSYPRPAPADQIASANGCDLVKRQGGSYSLEVQRRWSQGSPVDDQRIASARAAIEAAGHDLRWYQGPGSVPAIERVPAPWDRR